MINDSLCDFFSLNRNAKAVVYFDLSVDLKATVRKKDHLGISGSTEAVFSACGLNVGAAVLI